MKVSIVTVSYNSSKTIRDTITSVNSQTHPSIEHIFIDGASTDDTLEIIKTTSHRQNIIVSEKDSGIYNAMNKGIRHSSGDIIGFLHSDDIFHSEEVISDLVNKIQDENLDGVYGDLQYVDKVNPNKIIRSWKSCQFKQNLLRKGWMPAHPTLFLKREIYLKHGVFNTTFKISADYDFILRIFKDQNLKSGYLPKIVTKMRVGGASNRSLKNIFKKTKEDYCAIRLNKIGDLMTLFLKNASKIKQFL